MKSIPALQANRWPLEPAEEEVVVMEADATLPEPKEMWRFRWHDWSGSLVLGGFCGGEREGFDALARKHTCTLEEGMKWA